MTANIIVLILVLAIAFMYGTQGLFSSLIHLFLTIVAGAVAFAVWEPVALSLIDKQLVLFGPAADYAWAIGLLAPFALTLLVLRLISDRLVLGNVDMPYLANAIGGGAVGLVIAIITVGILAIGLNYIGHGFSWGYRPYGMAENATTERTGGLWIPVDTVAGGLYMTLSQGSLNPIPNDRSLATHYEHVADASGKFTAVARANANQALRPSEVRVIDVQHLAKAEFNEKASQGRAPDELKAIPSGTGDVVLVTTQLKLTGEHQGFGAGDQGKEFTATAAQVALICRTDEGSKAIHPNRFIVLGQPDWVAGSFTTGSARTFASATERVQWLFFVPEHCEPRIMRLKNLPLLLEEQEPFGDEPTQALVPELAAIDWSPDPPAADDGDGQQAKPTPKRAELPRPSRPVPIVGRLAEIKDDLPRRFSVNRLDRELSNFEYDLEANALITGEGVATEHRGVGQNIAIEKVAHDANSAVVRVTMARYEDVYGPVTSALGAATEFANRVVGLPKLKAGARTFYADGLVRWQDQRYHVYFPSRELNDPRDAQQMQLEAAEENLVLYFIVPRGFTIDQLEIGDARQEMELVVPRQ